MVAIHMIGKTIAQYHIQERLGEGGMGVVYKANDETLGRSVALKFLPSNSVATDEDRARLIREARAAAALMHPGICPIYEIGNADGQSFIAMAHLEGQTLERRIAEGPLPPTEAIAIADQVGEALASAHASGIVHRDVKPANVMLTGDNRAVLLDFGLAMVSGATRLTQAGTTMGTIAYMAPEQAQAGAVDERCDVWALGVMLYEMVAGRPPFEGDFQGALLYAILSGEPVPLDEVQKDIPPGLSGVVAKALAKDPGQRYQQVVDFVEDLRDLVADSAAMPQGRTRATLNSRQSRRRRGVVVRFGLVIGVMAIAAIALWALRGELPGAGGGAIESLGILPLQNLSGDANQDIWAQGVTEQLSASIGMIASLKVVSDQTMKQFKGSNEPLAVIGRKVDAQGLVNGSIQVVGEEIQITVKLYDAEEDRMIWSNTYRRPVRDILNVQGKIATAIAKQVEAAITPEENERLIGSAEVDPAAYKAFLVGWNLLHQPGEENVQNAIASFRQAIAIDPTYSEPYAGLSRGHWWAALLSYGPPREEFEFARAAAIKALEYDQNSALGHATLADVMLMFDWDWEGAETQFRKALKLNPNSPSTRASQASYLTVTGRGDEGIREARRSVELDPLNGFWSIGLAWNYLYNDRSHEAIEVLEATMRLHPDFTPWAYNHLAWSYSKMGRGAEACAAYDSALSLFDDELLVMCGAAGTYGQCGRRAEGLQILERVAAIAEERYVDPYLLSMAWDGLGDIDKAVMYLELSFREKSPSMWGMSVELWSDKMKADPRYQGILKKMNYPDSKDGQGSG